MDGDGRGMGVITFIGCGGGVISMCSFKSSLSV